MTATSKPLCVLVEFSANAIFFFLIDSRQEISFLSFKCNIIFKEF